MSIIGPDCRVPNRLCGLRKQSMSAIPRDSSRPLIEETRTAFRPNVVTFDDSGYAYELLSSSSGGVMSVPLARGMSVCVGRAADADISTRDPTVSRRHAILHVGDGLELEDLGSMNGTRVGGHLLEPRARVSLTEGTSFELGAATFVVLRAQSRVAHTIPVKAHDVTAAPLDAPIVADSAMKRIYATLTLMAPAALNILILGETGSGKEVYASAIHAQSRRATKPFILLNCASLAESLLEAELFGYEKGAFTGAMQSKAGLFEAADGGTFLLDEIGEMPLPMQAKLLRVLETGDVMRVGAVKARTVDVRIIAATHKDLRREVAAGRFRADLFFRINGMCVTIPPLRERVDDIGPLAERFIRLAAAKAQVRPPVLGRAALDKLRTHPWPGNVRELRNVIDRAVVMSQAHGQSLTPESIHLDIPIEFASSLAWTEAATATDLMSEERRMAALSFDASSATAITRPRTAPRVDGFPGASTPKDASAVTADTPLREQLDSVERDRIVDVLHRCAGNQSKAAGLLGISRYALMARMDRYGITRPRKP
jgi:two-component system, NtrC family, response regulator AtoC